MASNVNNSVGVFRHSIWVPFPLVRHLFHLGRGLEGRLSFTLVAKATGARLAWFAMSPATDGHGG